MVKQVADYVDKVQKKFPYLTKSEINKIITYGLKMYQFANKLHADVSALYRSKEENENFLSYCGRLSMNALKHYYYFIQKGRMKERVLYRMRGCKWDGYYYIGLNEDEQKKVKQNGKFTTFENVYLTKVKYEFYHTPHIKHIWKIAWPADCGWKFFRDKLKTEYAEYIGENEYAKYHQCFLKRFNQGHASSDSGTTESE